MKKLLKIRDKGTRTAQVKGDKIYTNDLPMPITIIQKMNLNKKM